MNKWTEMGRNKELRLQNEIIKKFDCIWLTANSIKHSLKGKKTLFKDSTYFWVSIDIYKTTWQIFEFANRAQKKIVNIEKSNFWKKFLKVFFSIQFVDFGI